MNLWCSANLAEQPNIGDWPLLACHPIDAHPTDQKGDSVSLMGVVYDL